jgi:predicted TIM-barrel fold metal-dependent hydrolase
MDRVAVISVDGHVKAPRAGYRDYVEQAFLDEFDAWVAGAEGQPDGNVQTAIGESGQWDPAKRIADLETQGVIAEVLFPNGTPFEGGRRNTAPDPTITRQGNMAYNRWLIDFCAHAPGRFVGQALIAFDDVEQAVKDIHWAKHNGLGGVMMPPLYPGDTFFFDPSLDPIWAACAQAGLPLSQHGGSGTPNYQPAGFAAILVLATEHSFFSGRSFGQMVLGGVFERFPTLRMAFVETETWWMEPTIRQLDRRMGMGDDWTDFARLMKRERAFTRLASEYWQTNCFAGISPFFPTQIDIDRLGDHDHSGGFHLDSTTSMFGVDYPHFESIYPTTPDMVNLIATNPHLTEDDVRRVLCGNAADLYNIDLTALASHVDRVGYDLFPKFDRT